MTKSKSKFKAGDKVKIILEDDDSWNKDVTELIGKIVTIKGVCNNASYKILEDNGYYNWNDYEFELIEEENNMMRYKAGDKVVLRSDLKEYTWYGEYRFESKMCDNIGQVVTIKEVSCSDYTLTDGSEFYTDEMIDHEATEELNKKEENKMKAKYKVGDKVIIREDLEVNEDYGGLYFDEDMCDYMGETLTITDVDHQGDYTIKGCKEFYFNDEMIDHLLTKELQHVEVIQKHIFDKLSITKDDLIFTKSDLKSGHVVRTRDESLYIFMKNEFGGLDYIFNQKTKSHMELFVYNEDLTLNSDYNDEQFDIIEVYEPLVNYALKCVAERTFDTNNDLDEYFKLVYKREEPKEMTLREIEEQLGYKIKLVGNDNE